MWGRPAWLTSALGAKALLEPQPLFCKVRPPALDGPRLCVLTGSLSLSWEGALVGGSKGQRRSSGQRWGAGGRESVPRAGVGQGERGSKLAPGLKPQAPSTVATDSPGNRQPCWVEQGRVC